MQKTSAKRLVVSNAEPCRTRPRAALREKAGLAAGLVLSRSAIEGQAEMFVGQRGGDAAALGAVEQAELHQVGLVDFFDGVFFFAERRGDGIEADRAAGIFLD